MDTLRWLPTVKKKRPNASVNTVETIEFFFESGKQRADGSRTRVWSSESLMGRMFVQFVALCYYEYLSEQIRQMKTSLGKENGDPDHDNKDTLNRENKLNS